MLSGICPTTRYAGKYRRIGVQFCKSRRHIMMQRENCRSKSGSFPQEDVTEEKFMVFFKRNFWYTEYVKEKEGSIC